MIIHIPGTYDSQSLRWAFEKALRHLEAKGVDRFSFTEVTLKVHRPDNSEMVRLIVSESEELMGLTVREENGHWEVSEDTTIVSGSVPMLNLNRTSKDVWETLKELGPFIVIAIIITIMIMMIGMKDFL